MLRNAYNLVSDINRNLKMNGYNSNACRICLVQEADIPLFGSEGNKKIVSKLCQCLHEQIEEKDGYPKNICTSCNDTLTVVCNFIKTYKDSNKVLLKHLETNVKEEQLEIDVDCYPDNLDDVFFEKVKVKNESKIEFDNAQHFVELLKPLQLKIKSKVKTENKTKIKTENSKNNKEKTSKIKNKSIKKSKLKNFSVIANSIIEGTFIWTGEKWGTASPKTLIKKAASDETQVEKKPVIEKPEKGNLEPSPRLCDLCGGVYKSSDQLKRHRDKVHFNISIECPTCLKGFSSKYDLRRHIRRVHTVNEKKFMCSSCGKAFAFETDLKTHIKKIHTKSLIKKRYPCKLCDRTFSCAKAVLMHERAVHTGERPAVCEICGTSFTHEDYLREHVRLHTGETPFKCPICGRGYAQRGNMKSHIRHRHSVSQLDEATLKSLKPTYLRLLKP